ncbi:hybrid-cluster NAD(P)-dependent oxidoreductase [Endozoicomonas sp.]|nr:hybrid-cluster NAD(P)-dependent oxidoreductase [Endozoicomonas sp.]
MSKATLSQITVYPVKSTTGIQLNSAWVEMSGIRFDRRLMIAFTDGGMVTARKYPLMLKVSSTLTSVGIELSYPGLPKLSLNYDDFSMEVMDASVWDDRFSAYKTTVDADDWFTQIIGEPVNVLYLGESSNRVGSDAGVKVSFADGFPLLVISEGSLDELNTSSPVQHTMSQFRTNLVISGVDAFAEDRWQRFRVGEVEFDVRKPCCRCILTTIDPDTAKPKPLAEPLATLAAFRKGDDGQVYFGQNIVPLNEGTIYAGDAVEVLSEREPEVYPDNRTEKLHLTCVERENIARNFVTFWFEAKNKEHLPDYLPGQHLPITLMIAQQTIFRRYTLSSSPSRPGRYGISVKRVDGGKVSNWLHDHFTVGDTLQAERPEGHFHLHEKKNKLLLMSAGSGITPMMAMLRYLADNEQIADVVFYHQCRTQIDIAFKDELSQLQQRYAGLRVQTALTQPETDWQGVCGRFSHHHLAFIPDWSQRQSFVCGPAGFMKASRAILTRAGLPQNYYHQESFGEQKVDASGNEKVIQVSINGQLFQGNNQQPLLDQAESEGMPLPYNCRAGLCGVCKVKVASGRVNQPDVSGLMQDEIEQGYVLACCSVPETDIELST